MNQATRLFIMVNRIIDEMDYLHRQNQITMPYIILACQELHWNIFLSLDTFFLLWEMVWKVGPYLYKLDDIII